MIPLKEISFEKKYLFFFPIKNIFMNTTEIDTPLKIQIEKATRKKRLTKKEMQDFIQWAFAENVFENSVGICRKCF